MNEQARQLCQLKKRCFTRILELLCYSQSAVLFKEEEKNVTCSGMGRLEIADTFRKAINLDGRHQGKPLVTTT